MPTSLPSQTSRPATSARRAGTTRREGGPAGQGWASSAMGALWPLFVAFVDGPGESPEQAGRSIHRLCKTPTQLIVPIGLIGRREMGVGRARIGNDKEARAADADQLQP